MGGADLLLVGKRILVESQSVHADGAAAPTGAIGFRGGVLRVDNCWVRVGSRKR